MSVVYLPVVNSIFKTEPISMVGWIPILAAAGALFAFVELEKIVMRKYNSYSERHLQELGVNKHGEVMNNQA